MQAYNIKQGRKIINTVFYSKAYNMTASEVAKSLSDNGELPEGCTVTKVRRVLKDEYEIQGHYGVHGWECECTEDNRKDANQRLKEYQSNCHGVSYRIVHRRVPV